MNNLKSSQKKPDLKINKKILLIICIFFCIGLALISVGIFGLIRNDLLIAERSGPEESSSVVSSGSSSNLTAAGSTATTAYSSKQPESTTAAASTGNMFENIASLSGKCLNWGQGVRFDEQNRPVSALSYQKKYAAYNADFIRIDGKKDLYLTFDEGYENGCTAKILDVLKDKKVPAVFFVTKPYAKSRPDLVKRMISEGHILGNHSVTHPSNGLPSQTLEEQKNEITGCHSYVKDNFNYTMNLFRFPSGKFSEQSLAIAYSCNYRSVFWSFAYLDYDVNHQMEEKKALDLLITRLHPGAIYLLHAVSKTNTDILGDFIDKARAGGYEFVTYR